MMDVRIYHERSYRSSRPEVFCKEDVLKRFAKFIGKDLRQSLIFNKVEIFKNNYLHRTPAVAASGS